MYTDQGPPAVHRLRCDNREIRAGASSSAIGVMELGDQPDRPKGHSEGGQGARVLPALADMEGWVAEQPLAVGDRRFEQGNRVRARPAGP